MRPLIAIAGLASAGWLFRHLVHRVARLAASGRAKTGRTP